MTDKLYYTDPLQAAYMSKEFGVKLANNNTDKPLEMSLFAHHTTLDNYTGGSVNCMGVDADLYEGEELYIHPDSYDIFKPQQHDLVEFEGIIFGLVLGIDEFDMLCAQCDDVVYTRHVDDCTLIQRDDKPFFTPERR